MSRELTAGSSWSLRRAAPDAGMEAERRTAATRRVTALAGVGVLVLTGAWLAFAAASNNWLIDTGSAPEPHWALGPLAGALPALTDASFSALLVAMLAGYLLTVVSASALDDRALIGAAVVLTVLFTLTSPLLSSDVFGYVDYARLGALHGVNPYLRPPSAVPHDAVYPLVYWQSRTTPYGPLFTLLTYPLAHLSVAASVWAVKALIGLGALAAIAFTVATARTLGIRPGPAAFLLGCNPLLLVYGVGGGHNDLLMAALCAAAVMALVQRRSAASGAAIVAAVAVKASAGLLLPFLLVAARPARRRFIAGAAGAGAVVLAPTLIVFGPNVLTAPGKLLSSGDFLADWSGPDAVGRLLGSGATGAVREALLALAAAAVIAALWRTWHGADWRMNAALGGVAVLCAVPSLVPWYLAWLIPVAGLAPGRVVKIAVALLTVAMVFTRLPVLGFADY